MQKAGNGTQPPPSTGPRVGPQWAPAPGSASIPRLPRDIVCDCIHFGEASEPQRGLAQLGPWTAKEDRRLKSSVAAVAPPPFLPPCHVRGHGSTLSPVRQVSTFRCQTWQPGDLLLQADLIFRSGERLLTRTVSAKVGSRPNLCRATAEGTHFLPKLFQHTCMIE